MAAQPSSPKEDVTPLQEEVRRLERELEDERRRAREVERRYRGLVDQLDAIFWEADAVSFEFTYVSPRAEPILGYPMERWLHEPGFWVKILHPEDREWVVECCQQATAEGRDNDFEYRALAADGRTVWLRDMVYVEKDASGQARLLRGVMLDVTAQKRIEEELRESGAAKDRFLNMLAHELRNPLGAVSNAVQVLRGSAPGQPSWERSMQIIERQVRHQAQILNDLLQVSRLTRGAIELCRERLDLPRLVEATVEDQRSAFEKARVGLHLDLPPAPVWIQGDPTQLTVAFSNLLGNALKFTEPGGRVDVSLREEESRAALQVRDTGIGLAPEMLPRVWDVFSQADQSLERPRGGLGLGLPLVKGLVELHGGEVRAESEGAGRGATFKILLPLAGQAEPREPDRSSEPDRRGPLRILVIEDNPDAADTLRDLLELFGHEVEVAYTGSEGLEAARRFHPEVVLCDIGLPGMDGYAVARQLREDPGTSCSHLIALTGYGRDSDRQLAEEAGFDLHLVKPVAPDDLRRRLEAWAGKK
jgi:PAS domain S-box-containing protein